MYITCCIQGGLGNQLFQIYTVLSRSLEHNNVKSVFLNSKVSSEYPNTFRPTYYDSIFDKLDHNRIQVQNLETLRDTLLPKLMSGVVRVENQLCLK